MSSGGSVSTGGGKSGRGGTGGCEPLRCAGSIRSTGAIRCTGAIRRNGRGTESGFGAFDNRKSLCLCATCGDATSDHLCACERWVQAFGGIWPRGERPVGSWAIWSADGLCRWSAGA